MNNPKTLVKRLNDAGGRIDLVELCWEAAERITELEALNEDWIERWNRQGTEIAKDRQRIAKLEARLKQACELHGHAWRVKSHEDFTFRRCVVCDVNFADIEDE